MKITPERAELIMEAVQLREFGWTQQQIADCLKVPRTTVMDWLRNTVNGNSKQIVKRNGFDGKPEYAFDGITPHPIRLFPCRYEEAAQHIEPGSIDLILTDPPYLVSTTDISRKNQAGGKSRHLYYR